MRHGFSGLRYMVEGGSFWAVMSTWLRSCCQAHMRTVTETGLAWLGTIFFLVN